MCKIIQYLAYCLPAISAHLVAYISLERFISILISNKMRSLAKLKTQVITASVIFCFNIIIYSSFLIFYGTFTFNFWLSTNKNTSNILQNTYAVQAHNNSDYVFCDIINIQQSKILSVIDAINAAIIPFIIMVFCSIKIIISLFNSRNRLAQNRQSSNRLKRDFSFSLTTLSLNFIFIFFTLPICVYLAVISDPNYTQTIAYLVLDDLYYLGYSVSVIIYSISNRMFREELRLLILKTYGSTAAS